jgi:uncharacterized protein (UPF0548 family)
MMISFGRPSDADLDALVARTSGLEPTYAGSGDHATGYRRDEWSRMIKSATTWDEGKRALVGWRAHAGAGVRVRPSYPPRLGGTVALAIAFGPASVLAPCRVVATTDASDEFGFTYATLPGHPEQGEETFLLRRGSDGRVEFQVTAVSRPADILARLGGPVAKRVQRRVTEGYLRLDGLA